MCIMYHRFDTCNNVIFCTVAAHSTGGPAGGCAPPYQRNHHRQPSRSSEGLGGPHLPRVWTHGRRYLRRISSPVLQPHLSLQDRCTVLAAVSLDVAAGSTAANSTIFLPAAASATGAVLRRPASGITAS